MINSKEESTQRQQLFDAIQNDDFKRVNYLIKRGASIKSRNEFGQTVLHIASSAHDEELLSYLVEEAKDMIDFTDKIGETALHYSCSNGRSEMVKLLIESGADVNAVSTKWGRTALHHASGIGDLASVQTLIAANADISAVDKNNKTALHIVSHTNRAQIVKNLVDAGSDVNAHDGFIGTPLDYMYSTSDSKTIGYLVESGSEISESLFPFIASRDELYHDTRLMTSLFARGDKNQRSILLKYLGDKKEYSNLANLLSDNQNLIDHIITGQQQELSQEQQELLNIYQSEKSTEGVVDYNLLAQIVDIELQRYQARDSQFTIARPSSSPSQIIATTISGNSCAVGCITS